MLLRALSCSRLSLSCSTFLSVVIMIFIGDPLYRYLNSNSLDEVMGSPRTVSTLFLVVRSWKGRTSDKFLSLLVLTSLSQRFSPFVLLFYVLQGENTWPLMEANEWGWTFRCSERWATSHLELRFPSLSLLPFLPLNHFSAWFSFLLFSSSRRDSITHRKESSNIDQAANLQTIRI